MRNKLFLDTHAVIWLAEGRSKAFSDQGRKLLSNSLLYISPMVRLELSYLYEVGRFLEAPEITLSYLLDKINLKVDDLAFDRLIGEASRIRWTRDIFDRLITAQAQFHQTALLTKDKNILKNYNRAIW